MLALGAQATLGYLHAPDSECVPHRRPVIYLSVAPLLAPAWITCLSVSWLMWSVAWVRIYNTLNMLYLRIPCYSTVSLLHTEKKC